MEGNLKYFLLKVCKDILEGDFEQRTQQFVDIARDDQSRAKNIVIAYVKHLVDRTKLDKCEPYYIRPSYLPNKIKPIKKLLTMNDLGLPWKRINSMFPERQNTHKGRGYTREEIKRLLAFANDLDIEFIILAASSGGLRNGTWDGILWGDILPVYQVNGEYKIAGRTDCIAEFDGMLSIIDFKSANRTRADDLLEKHAIQETAYAKMWEEQTNIPIEQIVTIVACENGDSQTVINKPTYFQKQLEECIKEFRIYEKSNLKIRNDQ
jgi:hypothetical protein